MGGEKQCGQITFPPKKKRIYYDNMEYCPPIAMQVKTMVNDSKSKTLALIKKVAQQWSHENERGKDIDVMV